MDKDSKIAVLGEILLDIDFQLESLQGERKGVESALRRLTRTNGQLEIESTEVPLSELPGPTEVVTGLFETKRSKRWRAREIRDILVNMRDRKEMFSDATDLLTTVHWLLLRFQRSGFIEKHGEGRRAWYRTKADYQVMKT